MATETGRLDLLARVTSKSHARSVSAWTMTWKFVARLSAGDALYLVGIGPHSRSNASLRRAPRVGGTALEAGRRMSSRPAVQPRQAGPLPPPAEDGHTRRGGNPAAAPDRATLGWNAVLPSVVALTLAFGSLGLVYLLGKPLALLVLAITLAQALSPFADYLQRYMARGFAVSIIYVSLFAVAAGLGWLVVPALVSEGQRFVNALPDLIEGAHRWLRGTTGMADGQMGRAVMSAISQLSSNVVAVPLRGASIAFDLLVVIFLSLYFLVAGPSFKRFVLSLFAQPHRKRAGRLFERMGRSMGGYVRGTVLDSLVIASLTWLGLTIVGLDYALVLAVVMFLGELIPYLGPILAAVPAVLVALVESPGKALTVALVYLAIEQLEGHIVAPNIMHSQTEISPALVIFALASGFAVGGLIGALVAIPLFAAARVLTLSLVAPAVRRWSSASSARERREHG